MRLEFEVGALLPTLANVSKVVSSKVTMPILSCVLFEPKALEGGRYALSMTTSDKDMWLTVAAPLLSCDEDMQPFCVEAKSFISALRNLNGRTVALVVDKAMGVVRCEYDRGSFELPCDNAADFPMVNVKPREGETETELTLTANSLFNALTTTEYAMAGDEMRMAMAGVHYDFEADGMSSVASDGRMLACRTDKTITTEEKASFTLGRKIVAILPTLIGANTSEIAMRFTPSVATFASEAFSLTTRLIVERYPNYKAVIPKEHSKEAVVSRVELMEAVKRVSPMAELSTNLMRLDFVRDVLTVSSENIMMSKKATEKIACNYEGADFVIGLNAANVLATLQHIESDNVVLRMTDASRAVVVKPDKEQEGTDFIALCMPLLLSGN